MAFVLCGLTLVSWQSVLSQTAQSTNEISLSGNSTSSGGASLLGEAGVEATNDTAPGGGPESLAFDGTYIWVTRQFKGTVVRLRAKDGASSGSFAVGATPVALLVVGKELWVANLDSDNVTRLRLTDGSLVATHAVGDGPGGLAYDGSSVWITNRNSNNVTKLRARDGAKLGTYLVGRRPSVSLHLAIVFG